MEFDKSKVYTSVNADELKEGSIVVAANDLSTLRDKVYIEQYNELFKIWGTSITNRFEVFPINKEKTERYNLCYLISEPEEKKLKWTDLKIGDIIRCKTETRMVTGIDTSNEPDEDGDVCHICAGDWWSTDKDLEEWEKVE